ncbi:aspartyl/asparaginyl beta-hydroxylase domain-containing protein [Erythrobacter sp. THAF29]|uniref:aspartyl/asparaginyl beta-hydroxylase domain-containing protein n=1 Tax=Erythrobacter sp. THAF29 TaxID=2587851 RepID=UPI001268AE00|nr:aspartyl/asparaginyl beta-hydroxylase domain-containing protein [Erythrobacter sp. THAF29]QFT77343.1 Aspartyl/Asparaginyl beta-hydroxylase [Erythrobacter sp. THAF29]
MDGINGFKRIFLFLVVQAVLLVACGAYLALVALSQAGEASLALSGSAALLLTALILFGLRFAWSIGASGVELFWGTSVKLHVERLMQPALTLGGLVLVAAAILLVVAGDASIARLIEAALIAGAILAPLGISALLIISAARRLIAYRKGHQLMEANLAGHHGLDRVAASIASESGSGDTSVRPDPQGFTFAGLTSKPWHDTADFPWVAAFEDAVDTIQAEFEEVMERNSSAITTYKYAGLEGNFWQSFQFATRHREIPENIALAPQTAALIKTIPHYPAFRDAMFSVLGGGGVIKPHRDVSNVFLTMHLPLIVPGNGFMEVAGIKREWKRGEAMIFDSSYHHQAQNNSGDPRVVLLVDFLHPDLTVDEAAWVTASKL